LSCYTPHDLSLLCSSPYTPTLPLPLFFFLLLRPPPTSTLFPYTTLFRSNGDKPGPLKDKDLIDPWGRPYQYDPTVLHPRLPRARSEEHTSELQSRVDLVCRLLLEKKKKKQNTQHIKPHSNYITTSRYHTC